MSDRTKLQAQREPTDVERGKGYARPLRLRVTHVGVDGPSYPLLNLTARQHAGHSARGRVGYVKFEAFPVSGGRHWRQDELDGVARGCGTETTLGPGLAEVHAKRHVDDAQGNYITCAGCGLRLPPGEFIWDDGERVGS